MSMTLLQTNLAWCWGKKKMPIIVFHYVCICVYTYIYTHNGKQLSIAKFRAVRKIVLILLPSKPDLCKQ